MMKPWDAEKVFNNGDDYFREMQKDISMASHIIQFESYIFINDALGKKILKCLEEAAARGIVVQLLIDGVGSRDYFHDSFISDLKSKNIQVCIFHPIPKLKKFYKFISRLSTLNRRNHRKSCIIDKKIVYAGGINVDCVYLKEIFGSDAWRDTGVRVEGEPAIVLANAFDEAFQNPFTLSKKGKSPFTKKLNDYVKLNNSIFKRRAYRSELTSRIRLAKKKVWITSPYFIPPPSFITALCYAARDGADVRLLLPYKIDHVFMRIANRSYYSYLLKNGVRIFEYYVTTLHAKTRVIDDWVTVGSSNSNYRSFFSDLEVDIVLAQESSKKSVEDSFLFDLKASTEILMSEWEKRSFFHRFAEKIIFLFHRWL